MSQTQNTAGRQITVALAGATGLLGAVVSKVFLSPTFKSNFSKIICLTRNKSSKKSQELTSLGAEIAEAPDPSDPNAIAVLAKALDGVDVVVNLLNAEAVEMKNVLLKALIKAGVKVYFPSEYGIDYRISNSEHPVFPIKRSHVAKAHELSGNKLKVVCLCMGLFTDTSFIPLLGFDNTNRVFTVVGSPDTRTSYTTERDIGRALVQLSILSVSSEATKVPEYVRVTGDNKSYAELQKLFEDESGKKIELKTLSVTEFKANTSKDDLYAQLRLAAAEGIVDFSKENHNDLVNPKEKLWKWETVHDFIKESKSKGTFEF